MTRRGSALAAIPVICLLCRSAPAATASQLPPEPASPPSSAKQQHELRTFSLAKPPSIVEAERVIERTSREPLRPPASTDRLRATVGLGYVQRADWGGELAAGGDVFGFQLQTSALVTKGTNGIVFDNGAVSLFDPDRLWRIEGGDVFSALRGASRGARVSWAAAGNRRPAIAIYGPRRGTPGRSTVMSYRDQIIKGDQTLIDGEIATDKSFLVRSRVIAKRLEIEASYRSNRQPIRSRDASVHAGVTVWRGISFTGGLLRSRQARDRSRWKTVAVRLPLSRFLSLTLERAFSDTNGATTATTAAMASVVAGELRFFHRYQLGEFGRLGEFSESIGRQQNQSMASYNAGRWLNVMLQLATQRSETGVLQHWEELQTTAQLTRTSTLRVIAAVPDMRNATRLRGYFRQELPGNLAVQADYGRLSAFQDVPYELDRSRLKVMIFKSWNVLTPKRGGEVRGRVLDQTGRPVVAARVKLGAYTTATDAQGAYTFSHVPQGGYELSLVADYLPADYAWDGRQRQLAVRAFSRMNADLVVAPLNAIHGRVYVDRNANNIFDPGEAVPRVAVRVEGQVEGRVTASQQDGTYSFYNLAPGRYTVRLYTEKLPEELKPASATALDVRLDDDHPVVGADFRLLTTTKPIIFRQPGK